jgi:MFS family permease
VAKLLLLFAINTINFFDRLVLSAVTEPLRHEWQLTDTQLGLLGTSFTLVYAVAGLPLGRLADLWHRKWILSAGLAAWGGLTWLSGLCHGFATLLATRVGVGVGEAACAPAATSLIGDLFPSGQRARAMSVFMLGLPAGIALSYAVSGSVAQHYGWRTAFFVAGAPGLALAVATAFMREPARTAGERVPASPWRAVLAVPAMRWIIASGVIHNFNLYAISWFLPALLVRYHGTTVQAAGFLSAVVIGVLGGVGMLTGGWAGDAAVRRRPDGRVLVAAIAILASIPVLVAALLQPPGGVVVFVALLGVAWLLMYFYYGNIYATIADLVAPGMRGTAMAVYFFAMYVFGAALGPFAAGWLSDRLGSLHSAMYIAPLLALTLAFVLQRAAKKIGDVPPVHLFFRR